ncbi:MAG: hypothetical protein KatS3mg115_2347 [Candidatus Poribacteria bacterium]|nr:MAG: hypothetical protein KatS3mg115_2347 [Candidatus Poribacteria bacterium]
MRTRAWIVGLALLMGAFARADLVDGLVLYMPLDEGKGGTVQDLSPNGFVGELVGSPEWVDGKFGKALRFKGATDYVRVPDHEAFHIEGAITQAAWIYLDRLPSAHAIIFGTRVNNAPGRWIGFGYGMDPDNNIKVWTNGPNGGFLDVDDTKTRLEPGRWYYLAYTHTTDNNGLVRIFVDGVLTHEQESNNPVAPGAQTTDVTIGTWAGEAWPGIVDEVRLWNRALSPQEIAESMNLGADKLLAVDPAGKLATRWGQLKTLR